MTGATGYIGGSVLTRLLDHPRASSFKITAIVRSSAKASLLEKYGIQTIIGSHDESDKVEPAAAEADIIFAAADVDNVDAARAILRGAKRRFEKTGKVPILIHTSGTGVFTDDARGLYEGGTLYDDTDVSQLASIDVKQPHRPVDIEVVKADTDGYVRTYIILPSTIYGIASGPLVNDGISNPHSAQIPLQIRASIARGQGGVIGTGKNVWSHVHVDDNSDLYLLIFNTVLANKPEIGHGADGYYIGANGEYTLSRATKHIAQELHALGKSATPEPTSYSEEELQKFFGGASLGSNSRVIAKHAPLIGWRPKYTTDDFYASIKPEVEAIVKASSK